MIEQMSKSLDKEDKSMKKTSRVKSRLLSMILSAAVLFSMQDFTVFADTVKPEISSEMTAEQSGTKQPEESASENQNISDMPEVSGLDGTEESSGILESTQAEEESESSELESVESGDSVQDDTQGDNSLPEDTENLNLEEVEEELFSGSPANPVHHCTKKDDGTDYTDWSYVYFGSYPQTEVTGNSLTSAVTEAGYDANGDAWVNGTKYRRISQEDTNNSRYFGDSTYRYFKWERIKWRVLKNNGSTLFLVADRGLDCKDYNEEYKSTTWENCTLRNWLNGTFYNTAFSSAEQGAVVSQTVVNEDNPYYNTEGGNNTNDNVYLLSIEEVTDSSLGFCEEYSTDSKSRQVQASDYSHAMGAYTNSSTEYQGNCWWWLRSPGYYTDYAAEVNNDGYVNRNGTHVYNNNDASVPALHINLSSGLWSLADDGTSGEGGGSGASSAETEQQKSRVKNIYYETVTYNRAVNDFYTLVTEKFKKDLQKMNTEPQNFKQLRQWDEAAASRKTNQLLTISDLAPDEAVDDAYEVLYDFLKKCIQTGMDEKIIKLDIDTSQSMTQINAKVVNKIYDAVKQESESFKGKGSNGYTVELNKTGIFGQAFGGVTIYGGKGKRQGPYMGSFCSNGKVVSAAINQYIEDLSGEVKKLYKEAAFSLWKDFRQKSQLSTVTEDMLKEYLGSKTDYLVQKGYGKLLTSLLDMKKGMDLVKSISSVKKAEDALQFIQSGDMKELYQSITKLSYTDKEITDTAVKNALEGIESARKNLESALYDYLYNDNTYDSMNMGEKMKFFWKSVFQCPVDVEVYDENKKLIGSVIDGAVTYTDGIYIELNGDVKTVYIPKDRKVHYKLTGTDDGSMNYMLEEYQNGSSAGRLNYYDVPLSKGVEYGQALETAGISDDVDSIPLIGSAGEKINASEYIAADDGNTDIDIQGAAEGNGVITGIGKYVKGDSVELTAFAEEGFRFEGWYEKGVLVEYNPNYRFTALESKTVTARFAKIPVLLKNYSVIISEKYQDDARVVLYDNGENSASLVISLYNVEMEEDINVTLVKYEGKNKVLSKENISAVYDGSFHFTIPDLKLNGWIGLELLDISGSQIAWIQKNEADTNPGTADGDNNMKEPSGEDDGQTNTNENINGTEREENNNQQTSGKEENRNQKVKKLSISGISKKIAAGKKISLKVSVSPKNASNKKVTWKTSNKKYATVNSKGVVTTKKAGKGKMVKITAAAKDKSGKKATIKIQIMKNAVTKVQIKKAGKTLKAGKSMTLKATVKTNGKDANKTLKWSTSNKKYATVDSKGKVKAKKAGKGKTVTITAQSTDGTNKKAKVKIKIK